MVTIHSLVSLLMWCQTSLWVLQMFVLCSYYLYIWHECCTKLGLGCYTFLVFVIVCPWSLSQTPFPGKKNTMFSSLSCSITFSLSCLKAKIASVQPLLSPKPICASLMNGSTLYLALLFQDLAYILPTWLSREMQLYIPLSLLLPFFFHIGTMTARCQSSGTFLSVPCFLEDGG